MKSDNSSAYKPWQVGLAIVGAAVIIILAVVFKPQAEPTTGKTDKVTADDSGARDKALQALKTEQKVVDIGWEGSSLWVGVFDDGTRRDGYAAYLCEVVREAKAEPVTITVKDVQSGLTLGRNECR